MLKDCEQSPVICSPPKRRHRQECEEALVNAVANYGIADFFYDWKIANERTRQWRTLLEDAVVSNDHSSSAIAEKPKDAATTAASTASNISPTTSLSFITDSDTPPPTTTVTPSRKSSSSSSSCSSNSEPRRFVLDSGLTFTTEQDFYRVVESQKMLTRCGWYHRGLLFTEAYDLLVHQPDGTFLVRDSSNPRYLYALSVSTKLGPQNIRIHYEDGHFRLNYSDKDAESAAMHKYRSVIELVQSYVESTKKKAILVEHENDTFRTGEKIYSNIVLIRPFYVSNFFPSLKHLSRLCVNRHLVDPRFRNLLPMGQATKVITDALNEYPYKC
jgi:suppressor of cytokine signaling 2